MRRCIFSILLIILVFLSGCKSDNDNLPKHTVYVYKNNSVNLGRGINSINISLDSGNLKIFSWDKNEIKYEVKHIVRGKESDEELENKLSNYMIEFNQQDKTFFLKVYYKPGIKNWDDNFSDIELTLPKKIKKINTCQEAGTLEVKDTYEGNIYANNKRVNTEIEDMTGQLVFSCSEGNLRLNCGKLLNESSVNIINGNITVKAACEDQSSYTFKTNEGNIKLNFPVSSEILLNSYGNIQNNQFSGIKGNIKINVSTKIGKIFVNGY